MNWGFLEEVVDPEILDDAVDTCRCINSGVCPCRLLRAQKKLLQSWDHTPLDAAITASMDTFAEAYDTDEPAQYMAHILNKKTRAG